jgi:pyruvate,water dikinase
VGGKNASLGEMIQHLGPSGIAVPEGFATTAGAYGHFVSANLLDARITAALGKLTDSDASLRATGHAIRTLIRSAQLPEDLWPTPSVRPTSSWAAASRDETPYVAVRSSAIAEDLPEASFAGQQESFLNVRGEAALLRACRDCYASLFTDRAISYRRQRGYDHMQVALSIGIQRMVRAPSW